MSTKRGQPAIFHTTLQVPLADHIPGQYHPNFFMKKSHSRAISTQALKNGIKNHHKKHELNEPEAGKPVADYQVEADHHQEEQQRGLKKSVQIY